MFLTAPASLQVLIAAKDPLLCAVLQRVVNRLGYIVVATTMSGSTMLGMVTALQPDVILMQVNLSDLDGFEVTQHIQKFCPTPVVLMTHEAKSPELVAKAQQAGAGAYLVQPISDSEIREAIAMVLSHTDGSMPQGQI